jgi:hypothetical protein
MRARVLWLVVLGSLGHVGCGSSNPVSPTAGTGGIKDAGSSPGSQSGPSDAANTGTNISAAGSDSSTSTVTGAGGAIAKAGSGGSTQSSAAAGVGGQGGAATDSSSSAALPTDGNQLALCNMTQGDCNKGYACYAPANPLSTGRGFCSKVCTMQSDCDAVAPSSVKYTCPMGNGTRVCEILCSGTDDTTSCPSAMTCLQTSAGGGQTKPVYHCKYPLAESPAWGPCDDGTHRCATGLNCTGVAMGRSGYCAKPCSMDADCGDKPSTGSIAPSCATITAARGTSAAVKACVLSCLDAKDGCPTGFMCVNGPAGMNMMPSYARCEY